MLARLEWEQKDRMSLLAQQRELEQHVEAMRAANLARKNTLESLPESLSALRSVCVRSVAYRMHIRAMKHSLCWVPRLRSRLAKRCRWTLTVGEKSARRHITCHRLCTPSTSTPWPMQKQKVRCEGG